MNEQIIVDCIVQELQREGYLVATEVANLYRSTDIAVIDKNKAVWAIECKVSNIGRVIKQVQIHKLTADKVFIGIPFRKTKKETLKNIKMAGVGIIYVMPDGTIKKQFEDDVKHIPYLPLKEKFQNRIMDNII